MEKKDNGVYCALPFVHMAIRPNGEVLPCCRWEEHKNKPDDLNISLPEPRHHSYYRTIHKNMLEGRTSKGCSKCYLEEKSGIETMRQQSISAYGYLREVVKVKNIEIAFSNLCNLACRHCGPAFSSKWKKDYEVLYPEESVSGLIRNKENLTGLDFSELTYLKIIGGEPLLEQDKFIDLIKRCDLSQLELQICTNGTVLPNEELTALVKQCKQVKIDLSIDDVHAANDYFRYPSDFKKIEENIKWYEQTFKSLPLTQLYLHCVINIYNLNHLDEIILWHKETVTGWTLDFDLLHEPGQLSISNLRPKAKEICKARLAGWQLDERFAAYHKWFAACLMKLDEPSISTWEEFVKYSKKLDQLRNQNLKTVNPELNSWMGWRGLFG